MSVTWTMPWRLAILLACRALHVLSGSCTAPLAADSDPNTFIQSATRIVSGDFDLEKAATDHLEGAGGIVESQLPQARDLRNSPAGHRSSSNISSLMRDPYDMSELNVQIPDDYTGKKPLPLVVMLHGYSSFPSLYMKLYGLQDRINTNQFIQIIPPGRKDDHGYRSWQAWGNKCGSCGSSATLSALPCCGDLDINYVRTIIFAATRNYNVDTKRIYVNGHSDGAAMAYRLACDAADLISAVMILAGSPPEPNWKPGYVCKPSQPVSILHIHGTADTDVPYDGSTHPPSKGAVGSAELFANLNACAKQDGSWFSSNASNKQKTGAPQTLHLSCATPDDDTEVFRAQGCAGGADVELWKIVGELHNPCLAKDSYAKHSVSWLLGHSKSASPEITAPSCVDKPLGWEDSAGRSCQEYAHNNWCNNTGGYGAGWQDSHKGWFREYAFKDYAVKGVTAVTACCACGGGSKTSLGA